MDNTDIIHALEEENKRLRKLICSKEPHRIKIKLFVPIRMIGQLDDLITKVKKIRENHYDVEIEVVCKTKGEPLKSMEDQAAY